MVYKYTLEDLNDKLRNVDNNIYIDCGEKLKC